MSRLLTPLAARGVAVHTARYSALSYGVGASAHAYVEIVPLHADGSVSWMDGLSAPRAAADDATDGTNVTDNAAAGTTEDSVELGDRTDAALALIHAAAVEEVRGTGALTTIRAMFGRVEVSR